MDQNLKHFLFDQIFLKIGCVLIHQISLMKNIQSKFRHISKNEK